ncbi:MAG TPA: hypothetical protein VIS05_08115 [Ilumatobacter sp.]
MSGQRVIERALPWVLRLTWVAVAVAGGAAVDGIASSAPVRDTAVWGGAAIWTVGVAAMAIPAVTSLTAVRTLVPVSVPAAAGAWAAGAPATDGALFLGAALLATAICCSADVGRVFVQASAYGAEDRHLLRPPPAYLLAVVIAWSILTAMLISGPLLLADGRWAIGGALVGLAAAGGVWAWPRFHRLSRRWLVVVPVGLVVHDHLVLAETLMLRRGEIASVRLAPRATEAADLTGPAAGHALEITVVEPVTAILAAGPRRPRGKVIHLTAALVAPTRPGKALASVGGRRLPVG